MDKAEPKCKDCGLLYSEFGLDTVLPTDVWYRISPDDGILCANCIVKRLSKFKEVTVMWADVSEDMSGKIYETQERVNYYRSKLDKAEEAIEKVLKKEENNPRFYKYDVVATRDILRKALDEIVKVIE